MSVLQALLWDVDGVLAETERDGHRVAFNQAFQAHGLSWHWSLAHYGELLAVSGGRERLLHDMRRRSDAPQLPGEREELARQLHADKNRRYAALAGAGRIPLREGVLGLMQECRRRGVRMGITTTTSRGNVDALLRTQLGPRWADGFEAIVCGEDVQRKKPDPEVYERALDLLRLSPLQALALEDSPGGLAAARAAGLPVVVTRSIYFEHATLEGAVAIGPGLDRRQGWQPEPARAGQPGTVGLDDLLAWRERMDLTSQFG